MCPSRGEDTVDTRAPRLVAEQRGHDERVREADLASVHETVARALDDREEVVVRGAAVRLGGGRAGEEAGDRIAGDEKREWKMTTKADSLHDPSLNGGRHGDLCFLG